MLIDARNYQDTVGRYRFERKELGDYVEGDCGINKVLISLDDIIHLLRGGFLYTSDEDYSELIALENGDKTRPDDLVKVIAKNLGTNAKV